MVCTQGLYRHCRLGFVGTQVLNAGVCRNVVTIGYNPWRPALSNLKAMQAVLKRKEKMTLRPIYRSLR